MQAWGGAKGRGVTEGQEDAAAPGTRPGLSPSVHPGWRDPPTPPGLGPRNTGPPTLSLRTEPKPYQPRGPSAVTSTGERGRPSGGEMGPSALQPAAHCCVRAAHWAWPPPTRPRASGEGHKEDCCRGFAGEPAAAVHRGPGWSRGNPFPKVPCPGVERSHGFLNPQEP